jgi:UDP-GlcNAc:undecaprenyl-phosphate GlcNAc-1-phosphate transferase
MSPELSAAVGFSAAGATSLGGTPLAIAIAGRTDFYDRPRGYRKHAGATPLLGGAAVLVGFLAAAIAVGATSGRLLVPIGCALSLWLIGTIDDRVTIAPIWRLLAETIAAVAVVVVGLGWKTSGGGAIDLVLSVIWVVGLVNAFNLMDNLDGACSAVGCVSAVGIGILAAIHGQAVLAGLAFGLAGGCAGFLPWNLAGPAKVFLGDGGSMPIGFLVAALAMTTGRHLQVGDAGLLAGALLVGVPILDTALVSLSRKRRGVMLVTGGRDHLTHRLLLALHTPRAVVGALALAQAILCVSAIVGDHWGIAAVALFALVAVTLGAVTIVLLDTTRWRPAGIAVGERSPYGQVAKRSVASSRGERPRHPAQWRLGQSRSHHRSAEHRRPRDSGDHAGQGARFAWVPDNPHSRQGRARRGQPGSPGG